MAAFAADALLDVSGRSSVVVGDNKASTGERASGCSAAAAEGLGVVRWSTSGFLLDAAAGDVDLSRGFVAILVDVADMHGQD